MVKVSINTNGLKSKLRQVSKVVEDAEEEYIDELARNSTAAMARRVQPFGVSTKQKDILEKAVYKDINKVYKDTGRVYNKLKLDISEGVANGYAKAINMGNYVEAEKIARKYINDFDKFINSDSYGENLENYRSKSSGRVEQEVSVVISDGNEVSKIKEKKIKNIGLVKAAFLQIANKLGRKTSIPRWLKKDDYSNIQKSKSFGRYVVIVTNLVRYASNVITHSDINRCIKSAASQQLRVLNKRLEKLKRL